MFQVPAQLQEHALFQTGDGLMCDVESGGNFTLGEIQ
jgi:hypothetical protein